MDADEEALSAVPDVGPVVAASIRHFFAEQHNRDVIGQLKAQGVDPVPEAAPQGTTLAGKTFVLTGTLPQLDARRSIDAHQAAGGLRSSGSVSKTAYLVAGEDSGSKLTQGPGTGRGGAG